MRLPRATPATSRPQSASHVTNHLRLVVKGRGHSYLGASNAPDSLMIWTRHMTDTHMHSAFVPQGCQGKVAPQPAITMGAGTHWMQAYQAVTTQGGRFVQGGGCTTVGVAGLILGGGFGGHSKRYGTAASSLLEAEVVTADGSIQIANACVNPDLFWALKGGGGGTFGVVSKLTVRTHELPEYFGVVMFNVKAPSDEAYRSLLHAFVSFYAEHLFNEHWGETVYVGSHNVIRISMASQGLNREQSQRAWLPFLDWVKKSPNGYSIAGPGEPMVIASLPARRLWDAEWLGEHWQELGSPTEIRSTQSWTISFTRFTSRSSSGTNGPDQHRRMSGGAATQDRSDSTSGATNHSGCHRLCSQAPPRRALPTRCLLGRDTRASDCISTRALPVPQARR